MIKKFWLLLLIVPFLFFTCVDPAVTDDDDDDGDDGGNTTTQGDVTRPTVGNDGINKGKDYGWNAWKLGEKTATITGTTSAAQYFYAQGLDSGWNAGNTLDASATDETSWGNAALNQALFDGVKAQGFRVVRIPVTWSSNSQAPSANNKTTRLNRVVQVVDMAHKAGLVAIINTHHDNGWLKIDTTDYNTVTTQFTTLWTDIANQFKNYGEWLIFEPLNEPRVQSGGETYWDGPPSGKEGVYDVINNWNKAFVDAVRATGGNNQHRYLMVKGYAAKPQLVLDHVTIPADSSSPNKLIIDIHYYEPGGFCLEGKSTTWSVKSNGNRIKYDFDDMYEKFVKKGYPVIIGECGATFQNRSGKEGETANASRNAYMEHMGKTAREKGLTPVLWDNGKITSNNNGEMFGLFNRSNGKVNSGADSQAAIDAFIKGVRGE